MTEILRLYNEIFRPPVAYCVICLRTEHDRRLVALDSLELFLKSCNLPFQYKDELQRVCWVCARRAAAAHQLRQAVTLSQSVHTLFQSLRWDRLCEKTLNMLSKTQLKHAEQLAVQVGAVRKHSMLCTTEVLVVATPSPAPLPPHYLLPDVPPLSPEEDCVLVKQKENCMLDKQEEDCVLDKQEEDCVLVKQEEDCMLVKQEEDCMLVKQEECVLVKQEDDLTIEETRVQRPPAPPPHVPSVPSNIITAPCNSNVVAQLVGCGNQMLLLQPVLLVPAGEGVQAGEGAASMPAFCSTDMQSYSLEEEEDEGEEPPTKRPAATPAPRPPPEKLVHTDWEDKIPMDIISYMDATDPLAVIAGPPRSRSPHPSEVIDLC